MIQKKESSSEESTVSMSDPLTCPVVRTLTDQDEKKLDQIGMTPVDCSFGVITEKVNDTVPLRRALKIERKRVGSSKKMDVTVVFAIRRPGCGACREHGQQLSTLINSMPSVNGIAIIKETNVDNDALLEFYNHYYKFPVYKDDKWTIYKDILGNRRIPIWKLLLTFPAMTLRYKKQNIVNIPFGGDIFTQGGVLIFDKDMKIRYIFHETYTQLFDIVRLREAIENARNKLGDVSMVGEEDPSTFDGDVSSSIETKMMESEKKARRKFAFKSPLTKVPA